MHLDIWPTSLWKGIKVKVLMEIIMICIFLNILLEFSYWEGPTIHRIYFPDEETEGSLTSSHLPFSFSVL